MLFNLFSADRFSGSGKIAGTTAIKSTPSNIPINPRRVRLYDCETGRLVRSVWSDGAAEYVFEYLNTGRKYLVVGIDHTHDYNAAVADFITPVPM